MSEHAEVRDGGRAGGRLDAVMADARTPGRPSPLTASLTFAWRAMLKIKHVPEQLFDVTLMPVLFTLMFTYLFGGAIAGSPDRYLDFLLPGILVQTVLFVSVYTGFTLTTDRSRGVFDRFRTLPVWRPSLLVGMLLGDVVRYAVASAVVVTLGLIIGFRPAGGPVGVAAAVVLLLVFSFGAGWIFSALGLVMRSPNAVMGVGFTFLMPVTFVSNIFVPPETLPQGLRGVVEVNPVTHLVTAIRGLMDGRLEVAGIGWTLLAAAALTAVFAPLTGWLYQRRS